MNNSGTATRRPRGFDDVRADVGGKLDYIGRRAILQGSTRRLRRGRRNISAELAGKLVGNRRMGGMGGAHRWRDDEWRGVSGDRSGSGASSAGEDGLLHRDGDSLDEALRILKNACARRGGFRLVGGKFARI